MSESLVALLPVWGYALLIGFNAVGRCGIPLPSTGTMLALGALVIGSGSELVVAILLGSAAALVGDVIAYPLGGRGSAWLEARAARSTKMARLLMQAQDLLDRYGSFAVVITRWPLSTLGAYLNLAAGATRMPFGKYITWCVVGELFWVSFYLTLGYAFSSHLDTIMAQSAAIAKSAMLVAGLGLLALVWRSRRRSLRLPE